MRKVYLAPFSVSKNKKNYLQAPLPAYQFHLLQKFSDRIQHAVFTRAGGVSTGAFESLNVRFGIGDNNQAVYENRSRIGQCFNDTWSADFADNHPLSANQTHSKNVQMIDEEYLRFRPQHTGKQPQDFIDDFDNIDAFVTRASVPLMVQVADCQAILMYDPIKNVVAAIHAGWKGLAQDISGEALKIMEKNLGVQADNILVGISPSLGPCCSFFSDPEKELPENFHCFIDAQKRVDLWNFSIEQLVAHGVVREHIELARICTQCGGDGTSLQKQNLLSNWKNPFFSFRGQQGITGRFGVVISLQ